ncbi:hypothetical protein CPC735_029870 [Coccidioides posadasii C735 delta SOWgp]|uniref:Uncharacterized protein n=2 Tax=Coccidioides posadasii TaxID=199306 RepID=A0A0J6FE45_COCPO|nr:hypothetical protein CPC735_029870 [Coccidioides posadasii C735 delta SOWgp]EER27651.1 hypothetical protein CPC735_029870 [Coccidioides posadasii C735 delta SOWgp]KMM67540.1 hypothetical protein CPAG_03874 [Coccidioides posadasii RMSCC 3488]|eukprot:XP_003069796.1 hypothetical protein CPC735_029870 [Coccidioides posadasii C735 delta SOWgp]
MPQFYQYGFVEPNRRTADPPNIPSEPILYQYIPAGQRPADPPAPTPPRNDAPAPATIHMTQQIYTTGSIVLPPYPISFETYSITCLFSSLETNTFGLQGGQQQAQVQFVPPAQQTYQSPAPMAPAAQAHPGAVPWQGATRAEIDAQNIAIAKATGATRPQSLVPYKPAEGQQWWCREVDGTYTLRTTNDIMENLQPGKWIYSSTGFPYFVRQPAPA